MPAQCLWWSFNAWEFENTPNPSASCFASPTSLMCFEFLQPNVIPIYKFHIEACLNLFIYHTWVLGSPNYHDRINYPPVKMIRQWEQYFKSLHSTWLFRLFSGLGWTISKVILHCKRALSVFHSKLPWMLVVCYGHWLLSKQIRLGKKCLVKLHHCHTWFLRCRGTTSSGLQAPS